MVFLLMVFNLSDKKMTDCQGKKYQKPVVVIACQVFQILIEKMLVSAQVDQIQFLDYGLHVFPKKLTEQIQIAIDQLAEPSLVVLGYGLCGNGLAGVNSGKHTLLIPKTDDCIAILLGSKEAYQDVFSKEPGTYYLTKGWLEAGSNPLQEYNGYVEKYGQEKAEMVMDLQYQHYTRLMFIAQSHDEIEFYKTQVKDIAQFCERWGMRYEERFGSGKFIRNLFDLVVRLSVDGGGDLNHEDRENFLVVHPNSTIAQKMFLR